MLGVGEGGEEIVLSTLAFFKPLIPEKAWTIIVGFFFTFQLDFVCFILLAMGGRVQWFRVCSSVWPPALVAVFFELTH